LLNESKEPIYIANLLPVYMVLAVVAVWSFFLVGGSVKNLKACCVLPRNSYNL